MKRPSIFSFLLFVLARSSSSSPSGDDGRDAGEDAATTTEASAPTDASAPDAASPRTNGPIDDSADASATTCSLRTSCPGAPLVPPSALVAAMTNASPGDIVSLSGMNESAAPCLPVRVCAAPDAPTLLFSDSPESPAGDGILYADTVPARRYRLYGMLYRVKLGVPTAARARIAPRGGAWGCIAREGTTNVVLPTNAATLDTTTDAIVLGTIGATSDYRLLSAGGSNLPFDLFLVTP